MGCRWLGLVVVLVAAAPSHVGGDTAVTEVPTAHQQPPCLQDASPAPQDERHVQPRFSNCMLRCAAQAMLEMAATKSRVALKLNEGREGEEQEFCWMLQLRCQKGERLTKAFVLLNLEQPPDGGQPLPYKLLLTAPPSLSQPLRARHGGRIPRMLRREACGIRFDVTEPFRTAEGGQEAEVCIKAICSEADVCGALRLGLRCPPFLATLWRSLPRPDG